MSIYTKQFANEFNVESTNSFGTNYTATLVDKLKVKPTTFIEWKQRHHITGYLNNNQKVKVYITKNVEWYDVLGPRYRNNEISVKCDIPCIWTERHLDQVDLKELKTVDALFCANKPNLPKEKAWKGQKLIHFTLEPKTHCPKCHDKNDFFDIRATFDEDSDIPTSYVRANFESWRTQQPFDVTKLSPNSTFISFIASHWTEFRESWIPTLQAYLPVASFGSVLPNTPWEKYPECLNLEEFAAKNCIISKYPFYLSIENCQEKDYSTEKLWDPFYLGVVPVIWGAPNTRSYLPYPKSAIFIDDYSNVEALANHLKYLVKNQSAYLEYHTWRTMNLSEGFMKKLYLNVYNLECNVCREIARLRIIEGRI
ncbi:Glycosyltransferase Family 10 protein [Gigaspora rosea]|uniref:Fucosyltransferase n=1 Tax=Gigaspora rosea TaxID=44941 RepID=A0A397UFV3_9GLOM|nr:Glycosyltransferase Family 10 protein [Gigaspora rosea]